MADPSHPLTDLSAAIVAGGRSSRYGTDKALALLDGQPLLHHVAASLEHCPLRLLIAPAGRYSLKGWQAVADTRPGEGPLAGLEAALSAVLERSGPGWLALTAVDLPRLTPLFWQTLAGARTHDARSVQPLDIGGRPQPLAALYHTDLLPQVTALLDSGERRLRTAILGATVVRVAGLDPALFQNINRPADLHGQSATAGAGPPL